MDCCEVDPRGMVLESHMKVRGSEAETWIEEGTEWRGEASHIHPIALATWVREAVSQRPG